MATGEREIHVPFATLIKIALAILLVAIVVKLWPVVLMIVFAVLIAILLDPIVVWLEAQRVRRGFGVAAVASVLFGVLVLFCAFVIPPMSREIADLLDDVPRILQRLGSLFPPIAPLVRGAKPFSLQGIVAGKYLVEGITAVLFVLVVGMYLLVEGRRAYAWLVSFVPASNRRRVDRTGREISVVVRSYMRGSVITSTICALYVLIVMTALHVPLALFLAVMAFVFDFVPVVGTIVMTIPATLLALLVSPGRALLVAGVYLLYHAIEAYILIPRIWGHEMRVSTLTVLLAIAIGAALQGVIGAVLALPIAAAYPIVERIWLREYLPEDTVPRHEALEEKV